MKRAIVLAVAGGLAAAMTACSGSKEATTVSAATTPARATAPAPAVSDASYVASGPIVVENQVDVASLRDGVVATLVAEPGTPVKKGQLLGTLDDRQISADLEAGNARVRSIEANLKNWEAESKVFEADYERAQKMWDAQLITKEQLDHAKYKAEGDEYEILRERESLNNARATRDSLVLEHDKTRIVAPFAGVVARRYVRVGQKVAVGDKLFWVTAVAPLRVKFALPEKYVTVVHDGQEVTVTGADVSPERTHTARIIEVSPVVDPASGTIEVVAQLEGPAPELRPGMQANIRFDAHR